VLPSIHTLLGPDLGKISLYTLAGDGVVFYLLTVIVGIFFMAISFRLHQKDKVKDMKWFYAGIGLALLAVVVFSRFTTDRPIGASTSYPYVADLAAGLTGNDYFQNIRTPGAWEVIFLSGAFLAGLAISLWKKTFRFRLVYENWERYKGTSQLKRGVWAFIGGFILIFGARMAGGCTSGHILSGGMQLAVSSLVFAVFVFAGLLITGKLFYNK
jgi:uncharacterized membrane protein YedE/YeeE